MRQMIEDCLKKSPAQIIGIAECEKAAQTLLQAEGYRGDKTKPKGSMAYRDAYQYITIRSSGKSSVLFGARVRNCLRIDLLHLESPEFEYKGKQNKWRKGPYVRIIIARLTLVREVPFIGTAVVVMVMHLNNVFANPQTQKTCCGSLHFSNTLHG